MSRTDNLRRAKESKDDEYFTLYEDAKAEISLYKEHLADQIVWCPCDDPARSQIVRYLMEHFDEFRIKRLVATGYDANGQKVFMDMRRRDAFVLDDWEEWTEVCIDSGWEEGVDRDIPEVDVVITNPPFSRFREFMEFLVK